MSRQRRLSSYEDYEKALSKGAGSGQLQDYQPWLRVQDVKSYGNRSVVFGLKTMRNHHFMSSIESDFFYQAEFNDSVIDIREQFPLLPINLTDQIARHIGVKHPLVRGIKGPPVLNVMTTDFLLTIKDPAGGIKYKAFAVKPDGIPTLRMAEKLEIERLFWALHDIEFKVYVGSELNRIRSKNIAWITSAIRIDAAHYEHLPFDEVIQALQPGDYALEALCSNQARRLNVEGSDIMTIIQVVIAKKFILVDLTTPIPELGVLRVLSNIYHQKANERWV
ncbi:TPA: TnsA endonuclease N-terminal domain-containing protein [Enterobacter hormaechei subsp. hoffmannii]|nr:Tn7 transposase TnsA N-terminal domain-containing protein [Enterobacter hormaechei]